MNFAQSREQRVFPEATLTTGLVTEEQERRQERWVCEPCFEDFATEFDWVVSAWLMPPVMRSAGF